MCYTNIFSFQKTMRYICNGTTSVSTVMKIQGTTHLILHILTTCLHLDMALSIQDSSPVLFWIGVSTIGASSLITNTASMIMAYWNMDFSQKKAGEFICVFFHVLQLGPIWRYLKLLVTGDESDLIELSLLRLGHSVIQDVILFVIEVNIILGNTSDLEVMQIVTTSLAMISMSFSYSSISSQCAFSQSDRVNDYSSLLRRILQWIEHITWHVFSLQARLLSFTLFVRTTHLWAILAPTVHLLCHCAIIYVNLYLNPTKQSPQCKEIMRNILVGYTQMFGYIGKAYQVCTSCVYFVVVSFENVVMITTWFISTEKTSLNTGLSVYIFLCHVIGTLAGLVVNQKDGRKLHISKQSSALSEVEKVQDASNQIDAIASHHDTIDTGIDFDTIIEYIGDSEKNQTKHESRLKTDKLPLNKGPLEEPHATLEAIDIMKHLISYNLLNSHQDTSSNELTIVTQLEPQINDHESSNSRNTNTVISSTSSTIKDTFNGNELCVREQGAINTKEHRTKLPVKWKNNMFGRPLPEPPWQHAKSRQGNDNKFERKWRSFSNSPHENAMLKGKGRYRVPTDTMKGITNDQTKTAFAGTSHKKINNGPHSPSGVFPNVNFNTVIPKRKSKEKHQLWTHLDWDLDMYTTESSTTDYASLPPRRRGEIYGTFGVLSSLYSDFHHNRKWRDTCSTCSSTDYFDLDDSEYGETWTWPPSKPGITREYVYGLPHDRLSSKDNVAKWLCNIPDEHLCNEISINKLQ